jgi:hypothetical protein
VSTRGQKEQQFRELALPDTYPRDLFALIPLRLPLVFVPVRELTTGALQQWLTRRQIPYKAEGPHRRLHGALVARAGHGVVLIDSSDEAAEQQFTAAHETVHFIEDHVVPRAKALKAFGDTIRPVIDGQRAPTPEESLSSVLNRVPLGVQVHLMARGRTGVICSWEIEEHEQRADRLALELLAPARAAVRVLRQITRPHGSPEIDAATVLSQHFSLPMGAARPYATLLLRRGRSRPTLSEALLGGRR